jgi:hypothetical protein
MLCVECGDVTRAWVTIPGVAWLGHESCLRQLEARAWRAYKAGILEVLAPSWGQDRPPVPPDHGCPDPARRTCPSCMYAAGIADGLAITPLGPWEPPR